MAAKGQKSEAKLRTLFGITKEKAEKFVFYTIFSFQRVVVQGSYDNRDTASMLTSILFTSCIRLEYNLYTPDIQLVYTAYTKCILLKYKPYTIGMQVVSLRLAVFV